jgi:hypothetical protein
MDLKVINPLDIPNWDEQILSLPGYSFFHSATWARVLFESYGYHPLYFTIFDGQAIKACLPVMGVKSFITGKRGVSLPFTDRCEPLASDPAQFDALIAQAKEYSERQGWKYLELRGGATFLNGTGPSTSYLGHTLDLTVGADRLFSDLRDSTRRNIRRAEKEGVEIVISATMDTMMAFCKLNRMTRKHHGLPPQPFIFFSAVREHVLLKALGFVVVASYRAKPVAAAVFFHLGRKALYKYGASDLKNQSVRANNLVLWKGIEHLSKCGFESLCFGRTDIDHDGLRRFKNGWCPQEYPINYFRYDLRKNKFVVEPHHLNGCNKMIFGKLPISVLNLIGNLTYRHMG